MGKTLLNPRHSLNAFFRSPSQLDVRTGGSQQKLTAQFAFSSIHKLKFDVYHGFCCYLVMRNNCKSMKHHHWLTQCHTAAFTKRRLANPHELFDESLHDCACVYAPTEALPSEASQLCAKMASECSREETLLLLRQTISRYDRLKKERLWIGNDAAIEDAFRDAQRER